MAPLSPLLEHFKPLLLLRTKSFQTLFLLKTKNQTILGLPFFEKNDISIPPKNRTLRMPNLTLQLTELFHNYEKISAVTTKKNHFLRNSKSIAIYPNTNKIVLRTFPNFSYPNDTVTTIEPHSKFENQTGLCVTNAIVKIKANEDFSLTVLNVLPHKLTIPNNHEVAVRRT